MRFLMIISLAVYSLVLFFSCTHQQEKPVEKQSAKQVFNPNGDSEMALIMREMYDMAENWKRNEKIDTTFIEKIKNFHHKKPTDPSVLDSGFVAFALSLNNQAELLKQQGFDKDLFNSFVNKCMDCHTIYCPGPKRKIAKLYIK
ncbi:MAG: hypothetical protein KatS3mg034_0905 [Vicingaceae bacterium]|nr:MAG: hypothetical protein KatS3mg034_0905 [Vicingaceae bacterium]